MTNEEAIEVLKHWDGYFVGHSSDDVNKALMMAIQALEQQHCEDCISRKQAKKFLYEEIEQLHDDGLYDCFSRIIDDMYNELPSVTPQYTDEEIDKIQAVEQAYVDKMVELAVEEIKERYSDAIGKMKKAIDEMTEIHSDGEFYIKNVDAKWIISKYLCGAEMSGGGEDGKEDKEG